MIEKQMKLLVVSSECLNERDEIWSKMFAAKNIDIVLVADHEGGGRYAKTLYGAEFKCSRFEDQIDTYSTFHQICKESKIDPLEVAYCGFDLKDVPALRTAGIALCSKDADYFVKRVVSEQYMGHVLHMSSTHIQSFADIPHIMPDKHFTSVLEWIYCETFGLPTYEDMNKMFLIEKLQNGRNICDF